MKLSPPRRAFALVLVLIVIVLATTMAVFFLSSAGQERRGVDLYARGGQVRHYANMAVNRVMGQINAATKEGTAATPISWASQPGMVRTYQAGGNPSNVYKLYSWNTDPVTAGGSFSALSASELPPSGWAASPAIFTDLNQPINGVYPIVDPDAEGEVEGFSIDAGASAVSGSGSDAPMPVKWLYVLEDGQMVAPSNSTGSTATVPGASSTNPIVGRVAFWTDDETAKVNINTASEGNFWDVPLSAFRDDLQLSANPPVRYEFQRTPGHPAMTSLSAVFPDLVPHENTANRTQSRWDNSYLNELQGIYALAPRISWGGVSGGITRGSLGGTYPISSYNYAYPPANGSLTSMPPPREITLDTDRLYVTADDLWFSAPGTTPVAGRTTQDALTSNNVTPEKLQQRLFFLTANSRAPETTLFETPRVSLWPITWPNNSSFIRVRSAAMKNPSINSNPNTDKIGQYADWITAQERLIAFDATLNASRTDGGDRYFFQRKDPDSPTNDWTGINRNQELVTYLIRLLGTGTPGFSGSSLQNHFGGPSGAGWLAFNALNFSRSMLNQATAAEPIEGIRYSFAGVTFRRGKIRGVDPGAAGTSEINGKTVVPLRATINGVTQTGINNFPVLEEASVVFYAAKRREPWPFLKTAGVGAPGDTIPLTSGGIPSVPTPAKADPTNVLYPDWRDPHNWDYLINPGPTYGGVPSATYPIGSQTKVMRAVMLLDFNNLEPGVDVTPVFWVRVSGPGFSVNGANIGLPTPQGLVAKIKLDSSTNNNKLTEPLRDGTRAKIFSNSAAAAKNVWQLVSDNISVDPDDVSFSFTGSQITVAVYACDPAAPDADPTSSPNLKIYEKEIDFAEWSGTLPMPIAPRWSTMSKYYTSGMPGGSGADKTGIGGDDQEYSARWRPNPGLNNSWKWAWSEFAPILKNRTTTSYESSELRDLQASGKPSMLSARNRGGHVITYYYRTGVQTTYSPNSSDPDDARESGTLLENYSTNFRKRVEGIKQREPNDSARGHFTLEGVTASEYSAASGSINDYGPLDLFANATEAPFNEASPLITPYDTVISMVATNTAGGTGDKDPRVITNNSTNFSKISDVMTGLNPVAVIDPVLYPRPTSRAQWHEFGSTVTQYSNVTGYQQLPTLNAKAVGRLSQMGDGGAGFTGIEAGAKNMLPSAGDWTGMPGRYADGGMLVRPDQEYQQMFQDTSGPVYLPFWPRLLYGTYVPINTTITDISYFSPNRQVPSPAVLGSLPRTPNSHWQTLAFSPIPTAGSSHPGRPASRNALGDHLLLDLFWMPIAEPYPISDQFSTAGKVNLNYQIFPFPYIERKTALHAALKNTWLTAIPSDDTSAANYKDKTMLATAGRSRYTLNVDQTLLGFDEVFSAGDIFRSASQICNQFLVPQGSSLADVRSGNNPGLFWQNHWMTSDNAREQPYNHLYSRVTTKSNTYMVHWRAQALRKGPGTDPGVWDENRDRLGAELRGSTLIERYIDPNATNIPDYATNASAEPLGNFYKWRTVSENFFHP